MGQTMRAVVQRSIGGPEVLRVEDYPAPSQPQDDQVLIRIRAGGVCFHDLLVRDGTYRDRVQLPLVPGHEMAGDVIAVGAAVTRIKPGDQVASTNRVNLRTLRSLPHRSWKVCAQTSDFRTQWAGRVRRVRCRAGERTFLSTALNTAGNRVHLIMRYRHRVAGHSRCCAHSGR